MTTKIDQLQQQRIFFGLTAEQLQKILILIQTNTYKTDDILMQEGETADSIHIILDGDVQVLKKDAKSSENYLITVLSANAIIGEMSILDNQPRTATIRAITHVTTLSFPIQNIRAFAQDNSEQIKLIYYKIIENIAREYSERLRNTNNIIVQLLQKDFLEKMKTAAGMNFFASLYSF